VFTRLLFVLVVLSGATACSGPGSKLTGIKVLTGYPSGSGLAYHNGHIYVVGDDAANILVLDSLLNIVDSIRIVASSEKRIAKEVKPDTEALAVIKKNSMATMLSLGSGSLSPSRDSCYVLNLAGNEIRRFSLDSFYTRLKRSGMSTLNIEGAASFPGRLLLANRGNKSFPKNHLIVTSDIFWENQSAADITLIETGSNRDTSTFSGISGLDYSYISDQLFMTISTENTYSAHEDGEIGQSYLWVVNDFSSKLKLHSLNPDKIINLSDVDPRFNEQKIESVCILSEVNREKVLILAADDDKGGTVLFRLVLVE
jgi:hypothetical protein